jgi:hypothetical protein
MGKSKKKSARRSRVKKKSYVSQRGGICLTGACVGVPLMKMIGAGVVGTKVYRKYKSHSSSSSYRKSGNRKNVERSETFKVVENKKRKKFMIQQDNKKVIVNGKRTEYKTLQEATKKYNQIKKKCLKKGFRRC